MTIAPNWEVARRCLWSFVALEVSDVAVYASVLDHPHPRVRRFAATALDRQKENAEPFLPALTRLLDDPDEAHATTIAGRVSVDPSALDERVTVVGRGVLALTACGLVEGSTPGALQV